MEKSFAHYARQYGALPSFESGENIETSSRYKFLYKTIIDIKSEIIKGNLIALFMSDLMEIWNNKYYDILCDLLKIDNFNIYQSIGFLEFLYLKNDRNFCEFYEIIFNNLNSEINNENYQNWFFVFDMISYIYNSDFEYLKIKYGNSLANMLFRSKNILDKKEYEDMLSENSKYFNELVKFVDKVNLIDFLNKHTYN